MNSYVSLMESEFSQTVFRDARASMRNSQKGTVVPEDGEVDEFQFYLQGVGFHLAHLLKLMRQLESAVELLTNYDHSKRISAARADHLIYNIENYLIRLNSTYDRLLQLTNVVFHLCTSKEHVSHSLIITNTRVQHRPDVVSKMKAVKKHLEKYAQERHTIVHKHSLLDQELFSVELFYCDGFLEEMPDEEKVYLKAFRANYLRKYVVAKKSEFQEMNAELAKLLASLFVPLLAEYRFQKQQFKARGF